MDRVRRGPCRLAGAARARLGAAGACEGEEGGERGAACCPTGCRVTVIPVGALTGVRPAALSVQGGALTAELPGQGVALLLLGRGVGAASFEGSLFMGESRTPTRVWE